MIEEGKDNIVEIQIEDEMRKSYIDYAMSVIVGRALPDVRDGLKPVHRRILYAMNDLGLYPEKAYRKSATVVGEVLGKYHPHGDASVYDAMVKMAQDFSMRNPLVNGHGNFGSVDGDSAAAMRYTEAKMEKLATELLRDIDKETVDFVPNYDESRKEPSVLPSKYPNLLVNGSNGIAVGMATSIPPHNLGEVIDGTISLIDNPDISIDEMIEQIKGPDFPTGGIIMGKNDMVRAYQTGRGKVKVRAKAEIEEGNKGRDRIIITEIPYQVNKARLIEKIADLVKDKRVEGISDLRDESNRHGMRIVIELKRDANPNIVLNQLYKHSQLEDTYSIIMLALVNGEPKVLNLKQMLYHYVEHQKQVITRRTRFELKKAQDRAHILEGLKIALDNLDEVIKRIRASSDGSIAKEELINKFTLTEPQAQAILDMRLQRLTGLERGKIDFEYKELMEQINSLREILSNEPILMNIIKREMLEIKEKFADKRRTQLKPSEAEINIEDLIEDDEITITLTHLGYIKRVTSDTYKIQKRGGKGISALSTREEDFVEHLVTTTAHSKVLFFTNKGRVYRLKAYEIPEGKRQAKGTALINILPLEKDEKVTALIPFKDFDDENYLLLCTKMGIIKKTVLKEFRKSKRNGLIAINLRDEDELIGVRVTDGDQEIIMVTRKGMSIRFDENDIRPMGRSAMGVKGITLSEDDVIVSVNLVGEGEDLLIVSENGYGKRTLLTEYRMQSRGGKGIKTYNINPKTGSISGARVVNPEDDLMIINSDGVLIRLGVENISRLGRATSGVKLMKTEEETNVVSIAKIMAEEE
ncbi:DNA gyrase subunit A [Peptoclostridium litorale DSM 5388]|uniref:DNA gyrase subunit A n=1 Tax=Peptoclostridium litorale DSM 5388 TaxID=1121324 RepID=A0A069RHV7_PEPLI|nr:DNA gyrase subunit A [Peptoclostridium litorale]KDR96388.1 DNA gyrase subunit A [Peptoclostridium litorale DSM 5388]SIO27404.1 DNA gyrase subunit A [Peptoclostridium litorale DSM 5388]